MVVIEIVKVQETRSCMSSAVLYKKKFINEFFLVLARISLVQRGSQGNLVLRHSFLYRKFSDISDRIKYLHFFQSQCPSDERGVEFRHLTRSALRIRGKVGSGSVLMGNGEVTSLYKRKLSVNITLFLRKISFIRFLVSRFHIFVKMN